MRGIFNEDPLENWWTEENTETLKGRELGEEDNRVDEAPEDDVT